MSFLGRRIRTARASRPDTRPDLAGGSAETGDPLAPRHHRDGMAPRTAGSTGQAIRGPASRSRVGGRIFTALGGAVFTVFSLLFLAGAAAGIHEHLADVRRPQIPCIVTGSEIVLKDLPSGGFEARIHCRPADTTRTLPAATATEEDDDYGALVRLLERYPEGTPVQGRLRANGSAVEIGLDSGGVWILLFLVPFIVMPGAMLLLGLDLLQSAIRNRDPIHRRWAPHPRSAGKASHWFSIPFGAVFAMVGGSILFFAGIRPWVEHARSAHWKPTPCEIESSRIITRVSSRNGSRRQAEILYRYEVDGRVHRSSRIRPAGTVDGTAQSSEVVGRHPAGSRAICLVDPLNPGKAVLERTVEGTWPGLLGIPFLGAGLYVLVTGLRGLRKPSKRI